MVKVRWDTNTGTVHSISSADGPGQHTDDAEVEVVQNLLQSASTIDEEAIVEAVMKSYDGSLLNYRCHVTADTYTQSSEQPPIATTIAFVEIHDEENKQDLFECDSCSSGRSASEGWEFHVRQEEGWVYHDWRCPACNTIVNTDLVETPEPQKTAQHVHG